MPKNPSQVAQKWSNRLSQSGEAIRQGVQAVNESPTQKAAARADAYVAGIQRAVADGKYQRGLERVSLEDWRRAMLEKGVQRISTGASQAQPKMESFLQEFLPHVESGQRMLESMPRGSLEQNVQRMIAMVQHNAKFRRSR